MYATNTAAITLTKSESPPTTPNTKATTKAATTNQTTPPGALTVTLFTAVGG